jgi:autotransporter-associated beta strand protein
MTTPLAFSQKKRRSTSRALLATLSASLMVSVCPAQTTVEFSQGQVNTTNYDTSAPFGPLTLRTYLADWATQSGRITGTGPVYRVGMGDLYLTNTANDYSGGTIVRQGNLVINDTAVLGTGPLTIQAGANLRGQGGDLTFKAPVSVIHQSTAGTPTFLQANGVASFQNGLTVAGGASVTGIIFIGAGSSSTYSVATVMGAGSYIFNSTVNLGGSGGTGILSVGDGGAVRAGSGLFLGVGGGKGIFNLNAGGILYVGNGFGHAITAHDATSEFNLAGGTIDAGYALTTFMDMHLTNASTINTNEINRLGAHFHGVFSGTGSLTKTGTDTLQFTAANTYSGGTIISAGRFLVNNTSGSGTGTGTVTIAAGATLAGNFTISGATTIDGSLNAGDANFGSDLTLKSTATTFLDLNSATSFDTIDVAGTLKLDGTVVIVTTGGYVVQAGTQFDLLGWSLLDAESFDLATDLDLSGAALAAGVTWDTSAFLTHGTLTAVPEPGTYALLALGLCIYLFRRHSRTSN